MSSHYFKISDTTTLHALITTPASTAANPTLIFLHYWGGSSRTWHKVTPLLSATFTTIALDHRGYGASIGPSAANAYSINDLANDVIQLLPQLHDHIQSSGFVLVGHSMGAKVAVAAAARKPEGLRGLVLVAPAPPTPLVLPPDMQEQQKHAYDSAETVKMAVDLVLCNPKNLGEEDINLIIKDSLKGSRWAKNAWPAYGMAENVVIADGSGVKVRVLAGELDKIETKERVLEQVVDKLAAYGFETSMKVVDSSGHLMPLECPKMVAEEIAGFVENSN